MSEKQSIARGALLELANQMIRDHDDYLNGMEALDVEEKKGVLVFKGNYFLDDQGLPTPRTTAVFNVFKFLAHKLSPAYTLSD